MARKVSSPPVLGPRCAGHPIPHSDTSAEVSTVFGRWVGILCNKSGWGLGDGRESGEAVRKEERQEEPQ